MITKEILNLKIKSRRRYAMFITLASLVVLGYAIFDIVTQQSDQAMEIFNWIVVVITGFLLLFGIYIFIGSSLDLNAIKKDKAPIIDAKFIKFNRRGVSAKDRNEKVYTGQVFLDLKTEEEKLLIVSNVELNKRYTIMYGKHTNIGVVIERK